MGHFRVGQQVGTWDSNGGKASITVTGKVGGAYSERRQAENALASRGAQGVISKDEQGRYHSYTVDDGAYLDDLDLGESVKIVARGVVDFVGDDQSTLIDGKTIYPPTGRDNGKVVHVMFGYARSLDKAVMRGPDQFFLSDDIARMQRLGYTVKVDYDVTPQEFRQAAYDPRTAGMLFSGHGGGGSIQTSDERAVSSHDLDPTQVSPNLRLMVFSACQVGQDRSGWQDTLGSKTHIAAWDDNVSNGAMQMFNSRSIRSSAYALDNLIEKQLGGTFAESVYAP